MLDGDEPRDASPSPLRPASPTGAAAQPAGAPAGTTGTAGDAAPTAGDPAGTAGTAGTSTGGPGSPAEAPTTVLPAADPSAQTAAMVLPGTADTATTSATTGAASPATGTANADVATHRISGPRRWPTTPRAMAGALARWTRRPGARLALPGALLAVLLLGTGVAGALVVPSTAERAAAPQASPSAPVEPTAPAGASTPRAPVDIGGGIVAPTASASAGAPAGRPADVLRQWAGQMSPKVGVPQVALEAYGYAELVLAQSSPGCGLKWTTLAAIGKVESAHGSANGATLGPDGKALPRILGPPLNGQGGTMQIRDSDNGVLDGDRTWDRAVGPMQFIPGTWESQSVDADNDGLRDPSDVDDAALAAGNYLCRGNRNLNTVRDWWAAILTYNAVQPYAQAVYAAANDYGTRSRT